MMLYGETVLVLHACTHYREAIIKQLMEYPSSYSPGRIQTIMQCRSFKGCMVTSCTKHVQMHRGLCMCMCVCACTHVCVCVCVPARARVCIGVCVRACQRVCWHACMHARVHVHPHKDLLS